MELKSYFAQDPAGNILPNATAFLYLEDGSTLATGLQRASGEALGNPFNATADGLVQFAAPDGNYVLRVAGGGRELALPVQCLDAPAWLASAQALLAQLPYVIPFGFAATPDPGETMLLHVFAEAVTLPEGLGQFGAHVGVNPAAVAQFGVQLNGGGVGVITIETDGTVTADTGGEVIACAAGDVLRIAAPDTADGALAEFAMTITGARSVSV